MIYRTHYFLHRAKEWFRYERSEPLPDPLSIDTLFDRERYLGFLYTLFFIFIAKKRISRKFRREAQHSLDDIVKKRFRRLADCLYLIPKRGR